jgi:archaeal type IV pilus assembly protein PilA
MFTQEKTRDDGVSPVVGVMLMLVVTIIIAAVVSAFSGGLTSGQQKAPQLSGEAAIMNTGLFTGSSFSMKITGVSEPIPTKNLKLITTWTARDGTKSSTAVMPNVNNYHVGTKSLVAPVGSGPGVDKFGMVGTSYPEQYWGNYTVTTGTTFDAIPMGLYGPTSLPSYGGYGVNPATGTVKPDYTYYSGTGYTVGTDVDSIQAVLGTNWNRLRQGDTVRVQLLHIPSGKMVFDQNVIVGGAN